MKWSLRYAVTQKSMRDIRGILPEGWDIAHYGQPTENFWFPHDTTSEEEKDDKIPGGWQIEPQSSRRIRRPDVVVLENRTTGNRAYLLDHSQVYKGTGPKPQTTDGNLYTHWDEQQPTFERNLADWSNHWNPLQHGEQINSMLSHLDTVASGTTLHLCHDVHTKNRYLPYEYSRTKGWVYSRRPDNSYLENTVFMRSPVDFSNEIVPSMFGHKKNEDGESWNSTEGYEGDKQYLLSTMDHELGHVFFNKELNKDEHHIKKYVLAASTIAGVLANQALQKPRGTARDTFREGPDDESFLKEINARRNSLTESILPKLPNKKSDIMKSMALMVGTSGYSRTNIRENYAEMFSHHMHPTAHKPMLLKILGNMMGWPTLDENLQEERKGMGKWFTSGQ